MTVTSSIPVAADQAVQSTIARVYAAWNANDIDAFVEPYAETATATLPGVYLPNKAAGRAAMAAAFPDR